MLSVIIPTYNRKDVLRKCLEALYNQRYAKEKYEIILIDDGSSDGTEAMISSLASYSPVIARYFRQENKGPAAARNVGVRNAKGELVLFIGDDIIATPTLLEKHTETHVKYRDQNIAVLGFTTWSPEIKKTLLMNYLEESGAQFGYASIQDRYNVPYKYFYTSNISLKRQFLLENGLFDEDFPYAAWEDIELGFRLTKNGLRLILHPEAVGYHYHAVRKKDVKRRFELSGEAASILYRKHPELPEIVKLRENIFAILEFNYKSLIKTLIYHMPLFIQRIIPKGYVYKSYRYMLRRYVRRGCEIGRSKYCDS